MARRGLETRLNAKIESLRLNPAAVAQQQAALERQHQQTTLDLDGA